MKNDIDPFAAAVLDAEPGHDLTVLIGLSAHGSGATATTVGMASRGHPELEVQNITPEFLAHGAARMLEQIAAYICHGGQSVAPGETLVLSPDTIVRIEEGVATRCGSPCCVISDDPDVFCPECEGGDHVLYQPCDQVDWSLN